MAWPAAAKQAFAVDPSDMNARGFARGFMPMGGESGGQVHEVKDPVDEAKTLDVWHEVVYEKAAEDVGALVDEVRWAVELEKYVAD